MIAKCPKCGLIQIKTQRKRCPHCRCKLDRPTLQELHDLGDQAMHKCRAARAIIECYDHGRQSEYSAEQVRRMKLAAYMSIFHGITMSQGEIVRMFPGPGND